LNRLQQRSQIITTGYNDICGRSTIRQPTHPSELTLAYGEAWKQKDTKRKIRIK